MGLQKVRTEYTAALWAAYDPVLANGTEGIESDTRKVKRGDGLTKWNSLPYASDLNAASITELVADLTEATSIVGGDALILHKAPVSRTVIGTVDTGALADESESDSDAELTIVVGAVTLVIGTDVDPDADTAAIVAALDAVKDDIPALTVVDNTDDTFTITFEPGTAANSLATTSDDVNLTFEEDVEGADATVQYATMTDIAAAVEALNA